MSKKQRSPTKSHNQRIGGIMAEMEQRNMVREIREIAEAIYSDADNIVGESKLLRGIRVEIYIKPDRLFGYKVERDHVVYCKGDMNNG